VKSTISVFLQIIFGSIFTIYHWHSDFIHIFVDFLVLFWDFWSCICESPVRNLPLQTGKAADMSELQVITAQHQDSELGSCALWVS